MKTLFSRILIAQVVAVVLALLVVTMITRASLNKSFKTFLERQEAIRAAMSMGMPLHQIEEYLDWIDSLRSPPPLERKNENRATE